MPIYYETPVSNYTSTQMLTIWSEFHKRQLWRQAWYVLLATQIGPHTPFPEYTSADYMEAKERELVTHHDLAAELLVLEDSLPDAIKSKIHMGATSSDIEDFATYHQIEEAIGILLSKLRKLMGSMADFCEAYKDKPCLGRTHLQPAEPTTIGYRFSMYLSELLDPFETLLHSRMLHGFKGFRGAVGNYVYLGVLQDLLIPMPHVSWSSGQTYPRQQDYRVLAPLADIGITLHKMALDIRLMCSYGLMREGKGEKQIGSSAMPAKSNPIKCERVCALTRHLTSCLTECWNTASQTMLERTLDDKISQRWYLPEAFLTLEGALNTMQHVVENWDIDVEKMEGEVLANWRSWVPAMALTWLQANSTMPRSVLYEQVEIAAKDAFSMHDFLYRCGHPSIDWDELLKCRPAVEITENVIRVARDAREAPDDA